MPFLMRSLRSCRGSKCGSMNRKRKCAARVARVQIHLGRVSGCAQRTPAFGQHAYSGSVDGVPSVIISMTYREALRNAICECNLRMRGVCVQLQAAWGNVEI